MDSDEYLYSIRELFVDDIQNFEDENDNEEEVLIRSSDASVELNLRPPFASDEYLCSIRELFVDSIEDFEDDNNTEEDLNNPSVLIQNSDAAVDLDKLPSSASYEYVWSIQELSVDDILDFTDDDDNEEVNCSRVLTRTSNDDIDLDLRLPSFASGITDDDLRETAFEILLACAGASSGIIVPSKEKKKAKISNFFKKRPSKTVSATGLVGSLETVRFHLEIPDAMVIRTRQGLLHALDGKVGKRVDNLLVPLELLCCISRTQFTDNNTYLRWLKRQLNMLEEGLINHPAVAFRRSGCKPSELRILLRGIEESECLPPTSGELQRTKCLKSLREIALPLVERRAPTDLTGEVCHWADGYYLNIRLYEKLLSGVFDPLDEGRLTKEVKEVLDLLKSTWYILGITETIHHTCYAWVLFRQFVVTGKLEILRFVIEQLRKIPLKRQRDPMERLRLQNFRSKVENDNSFQELTFLQSLLSPIQVWADRQLTDYHLKFAEGTSALQDIVVVAFGAQRLLIEESDQMTESTEQDQIESYISSSLNREFSRIITDVESKAAETSEHALALLAMETQKLLRKDASLFLPCLLKWYPGATAFAASLLHKLYGKELKYFLDGVEHLTGDVQSIIPAAEILEQYVITLVTSLRGGEIADSWAITSYQLETVSERLVLSWLSSQLGNMLTLVERSVQLEKWTKMSEWQAYGSSIVDISLFVEEAVDAFFKLKVSMRSTELSSLFNAVHKVFEAYTNHVVDKLVSKELIPPVPILTRYEEKSGIKAFFKKGSADPTLPDGSRKVLKTPELCVRVNNLFHAIEELKILEAIIQERWTMKKTQGNFNIKRSMDGLLSGFAQIDSFNGIRKDIDAAIDIVGQYLGTKIVFWDLRDAFINNLYIPNVSESRLESLFHPLEEVMDQLCDFIKDGPIRERIVTALLQAIMEGLLRVVLDGGSSRQFLPNDVIYLQKDLDFLKDFFINGRYGLSEGVVENHISHVRPIIKLLGYETWVLIDDLRLEIKGGKSKLGADTQTLVKILCHRSDPEASKFLKEQYKIPWSDAPIFAWINQFADAGDSAKEAAGKTMLQLRRAKAEIVTATKDAYQKLSNTTTTANNTSAVNQVYPGKQNRGSNPRFTSTWFKDLMSGARPSISPELDTQTKGLQFLISKKDIPEVLHQAPDSLNQVTGQRSYP